MFSFSYLGQKLLGITPTDAAAEEIDQDDYVGVELSVENPEEGSDYVTVPKAKQVQFSDDLVTYIPDGKKPTEGRIVGFQKIGIVTEEKDDLVTVDIAVEPRKSKETECKAGKDLSFLSQLVKIDDLVKNPSRYVTTTILDANELRQACLQTTIQALQRLTGVSFSLYYTPSGIDLRTDAIDIKQERRHFAFIDSFIMMKNAINFKRKALRDSQFHYIIDEINIDLLVTCLQTKEQTIPYNEKLAENARLQYRLIKKYYQLNKDKSSPVASLIVSEASTSTPYPHLRTRFVSQVIAEKQYQELQTLAIKCKQKLISESKDALATMERLVKLCLKHAASAGSSAEELLRDFDYAKEFSSYQLTDDQAADKITVNAERILDFFQRFEAENTGKPKSQVLDAVIQLLFSNQYPSVAVDSKAQREIEWKLCSGYQLRTLNPADEKTQQQTILAISPQYHDRFIAAMGEWEPRLLPFINGTQPWDDEVIPVVPVYEQAQLFHQASPINEAAQYYLLATENRLDDAIDRCVFALMKKQPLEWSMEVKTAAETHDTDPYQLLLVKEARLLAECKLDDREREQLNSMIEAMINYVIDIFDVIRQKKRIQRHQVEFLAFFQVLLTQCMKGFDGSLLRIIAKQFDLTKPIADDYFVAFTAYSRQLKPSMQSSESQTKDITEDEKMTLMQTNIINELLTKLEQYGQAWSTVKAALMPERLLANLIASIKANANTSPSFLVSLIVFNWRCLTSVVYDRLGCRAELADILRQTLARFEAEIISKLREKSCKQTVADGLPFRTHTFIEIEGLLLTLSKSQNRMLALGADLDMILTPPKALSSASKTPACMYSSSRQPVSVYVAAPPKNFNVIY